MPILHLGNTTAHYRQPLRTPEDEVRNWQRTMYEGDDDIGAMLDFALAKARIFYGDPLPNSTKVMAEFSAADAVEFMLLHGEGWQNGPVWTD